jgi:glycosyltransferase involved in cell wall biosynthesis
MMIRKAVHIYFSTFENESRILKETKSLIENDIVDQIIVLARGREGLSDFEKIDDQRSVYRLRPRFQQGKKLIPVLKPIILLIKLLDIFFQIALLIRDEKPRYVNFHQVLLLPLIPLIKLMSSKTQFIYDTHELETECNGLFGFKKKLFKLFESWFIKSCKLVIVVGPAIERWYRNEYKISNVITVMNCPLYQKVERKDHFRKEFGIPDNAKVFIYQGALFEGRGLEQQIEAFSTINDPAYSIVFMGYGEMAEYVKAAAAKYSNIHFKPAVHPSIVLEYTSSADVGIVFTENVCLSYYYGLGNKLFEYLMAEIPCIVTNMKEMSDYVRKNGTGIISEGTNAEALIASVKAMDHFDFAGFRERVESVKREYCWETQEAVMIQAYKKLQNKS